MRDAKRSSEPDEAETKKRRYTESGRDKARERFHRGEDAGAAPLSGFSRRPNSDSENSDDGDADGYSRRKARLKDADSSRRSGCKTRSYSIRLAYVQSCQWMRKLLTLQSRLL